MRNLRFTIYDLQLKLAAVLLIAVILNSAAMAQTVKKFSDYPRLSSGGNDDLLLLVTNDPNGTPVTYSIGLEELIGYWVAPHEKGGLEADVSAYDGFVKISGGLTSAVTDNSVDWNTAYGWGDHAGLYDDLGTADANMVLHRGEFDHNDISLGATAYGWGDHTGLYLLDTGDTGTGVYDFGGATSFEIPSDESTDATLTVLGQVHIRGDEDRFSAHLGAGGEIAGEATMSFLKKISVTLDPGLWYDSSTIIDLGPILAKKYPNGIIIDYWEVTCHLNPDVEMNMNLGYSVNSFDMADPNLIDVLDTTAGASSEDTDANINGGAAVPAGVYLMIYFDADPEGTCTMLTVTILYHDEED